jgi:hypothetical protein
MSDNKRENEFMDEITRLGELCRADALTEVSLSDLDTEIANLEALLALRRAQYTDVTDTTRATMYVGHTEPNGDLAIDTVTAYFYREAPNPDPAGLPRQVYRFRFSNQSADTKESFATLGTQIFHTRDGVIDTILEMEQSDIDERVEQANARIAQIVSLRDTNA